MEFNIHKYNNRKFSKDKLTHNRIKLFLLKFDYEVYKKNLDFGEQIEYIDDVINILLEFELYEVIPFFKKLRAELIREHYPMKETIPFFIRVKNNIIKTYKRWMKKT